MPDKKPRGRSKMFGGVDEWLVKTLAHAIASLEPGQRLEGLEIGRFLKPPEKVYIRIRPGPEQESTSEILLGKSQAKTDTE